MTPPPLVDRMLAALETRLREEVTVLNRPPFTEMHDMMAYHLGWLDPASSRGKRLRPLLTLLCCDAAGGEWEQALSAAAAIELVHNFSLIHDDIEDESATRRGRPTVWKRWGLPQALNVGDAMYTLAFHVLNGLEREPIDPARMRTCRRLVEDACLALTRGQYLDIAFEKREHITLDEYLMMIGGKTAALLAASTAVGASLAADSPTMIHAYHSFGHHLGLAFQIEDDILGIWGNPEQTGKPAGDDLLHRKVTFPVLAARAESSSFREMWNDHASPEDLLVEINRTTAQAASRDASDRHTRIALESLDRAQPAGDSGAYLAELARGLLKRPT